ncbi:MAG TPA: GNAT family N-acetyltransferase [Steroidobacteraceae bacterium]|nr:GNAT family N-acetyltransferase [Steroidobacteraceae bacterium]
MSPPRIRAARAGDVPALALLIEQYWSFERIGGFELERMQTLLRQALSLGDRVQCWLAQSDREVCGYLIAVLMFSLEHGGMMAEIDEFFVAPAFRNSGIGAALLSRAEASLKRKGVRRLQLQLGSGNVQARAFYASRGYQPRSSFELWDKALHRA